MSYTPAKRTQQAISKPTNDLVGMIHQYQSQIKAALPKHMSPERMTRIIMTEVRKNPKLAECDKASFFGGVILCSQLGLEPGTGLGHAYLLPYSNKGNLEAQVIIGYQGMIDLVERSGKVTVDAHVVYENDEFEFELGINPNIKHKPTMEKDRGEIIASYAIARYQDGRYKFRVIPRSEIDSARDASKSGKSNYSPWATHYAEMARKTAVRRLFKLLPKSPEIAKAIEIENKAESGQSQQLEEILDVHCEPAIEIQKEENLSKTEEDKK